MIGYIFSRLLIMSLSGTVSLLLLLLLMSLTRRRFSAKWRYYSLIAAMLVFLIPLSIRLPKQQAIVPKEESIIEDTEGFKRIVVYLGTEKGIQTAPPTQMQAAAEESFDYDACARVCGYVWFFGAAAYFLRGTLSYFLFKAKLKRQSYPFAADIECKRLWRLRKTPLTSSPILIGFFKPTLYLPDRDISLNDTENIIRHERIHLLRFDLQIKWVCLIAKSLHWFNPAIYVLTSKISTECEISCDVEATKQLDSQGAASYCETILSMITCTQKGFSPALGMGDTKKNLERRFRAIMEQKTQSRKVAIISAIVAGVLILSALTASAIFGGKVEKKENSKKTDKAENSISTEDTVIDYEPMVIYREPSQDSEIATLKVDEYAGEVKAEYKLIPSDMAEDCTVRVHPITGEKATKEADISYGFDKEKHPATDYRLESGTIITSPIDGKIITAEYAPDKGNHIRIESLDGSTEILFAHLEKMYLKSGDKVNAGDTVGTVGTTGRSTGPHLHVEYYENGEAINPVEVFITEENGEILAVYSKPERIID